MNLNLTAKGGRRVTLWLIVVVWVCGGGLLGDLPTSVFAQAAPKAKSGGKFTQPKTLMPGWQGAKMKVPGRPSNVDPYVPDPFVEAEAGAAAKLVPIKLPTADATEESTSLIVNHKSRRALVSYLKPGKAGITRLVMCDLDAGKVLDAFTVPTAAVPMCLADDGEHIAVRFLPQAGPGDECHLEVWAWGEKGITREVRFLPHDDSLKHNERFTFATFLDDNRLATLSTVNQLMVWEWRTAKLVFIFDKYNPYCDLGVSPNKKYLFATDRNTSLAVIDTSNFNYAGYYSPRGYNDDFRIHPSGSQVLACSMPGTNLVGEAFATSIPEDRTNSFFQMTQLGLGRLLAFPNSDVALFEGIEKPAEPDKPAKPEKAKKSPKAKTPAKLPNQSVGTIAVHHIDPETQEDLGIAVHRIDSTKVTTSKVMLVDLQTRVRAWEYTGIDRLASAGSQCWCLTRPEKGQPASLVPLDLPGAELKEQVAKLAAEPEYFLLKDSGTVKLNLSGIPAKDREAAIPILEKQLKENNVTIDDKSDLELVAKVGPYRVKNVMSLAQAGNMALIGNQTHRQLTVDVTLQLRGETVYSNVLANHVSLLDKRRDETAQQYYDRNPGTPLECLATLHLPKVIFGPKGNKPLGSTNVAQVETP